MIELIDDGMLGSEWCPDCHKAYAVCECGHDDDAISDGLQEAALALSARLKKAEAENRELRKAAERVYQLRSEAPAGEKFTEFYSAVLRLGHVLKEKI
jgi:hypothetical protein